MSETGTNPETTSEFTSHEDFVADILSRPQESTETETAEEPGTQTQEAVDEKPKEAAATEAKPDAQKPEPETKFELPKQQSTEYEDGLKAHYAKRWGSSLEAAKGNPALMSAIKQAIDKDIYIEQLKAESAAQPKTETKPEAPKETPKTEEAAKPAVTSEDYLQQLAKEAGEVNSPEMSKAFTSAFWKVFNVNIDDPAVQKDLQDKGFDMEAPAKQLTPFVYNVAKAAAAKAVEAERSQFNARVEQAYPGISDMHASAVRASAWDAVRSSNEAYKDLPEYDAKGFQGTIDKVLEQNPWIDKMQIEGASVQDLVKAKYEIAARIMSGQTAKPADIAQAVEAGRKHEREVQQSAARGKLDSGTTRGTPVKKGSGSDIVDAYYARHASL